MKFSGNDFINSGNIVVFSLSFNHFPSLIFSVTTSALPLVFHLVGKSPRLACPKSSNAITFSPCTKSYLPKSSKLFEEDAEDDKEEVEDDMKEAKVTDEVKAQMEALMAENESLKQFKADVEKAQEDAQFEAVVSEIAEFVAEEKLSEIKEKRAEFESVNLWANFAKAEAFEFAKGSKKEKKETHVKAAFAFNGEDDKPKKSAWDKY